MKITFSWFESTQSHHTYTWDVPFLDAWAVRKVIDDQLELHRRGREINELKAQLAAVPRPTADEKPLKKDDVLLTGENPEQEKTK